MSVVSQKSAQKDILVERAARSLVVCVNSTHQGIQAIQTALLWKQPPDNLTLLHIVEVTVSIRYLLKYQKFLLSSSCLRILVSEERAPTLLVNTLYSSS